MNLSEGPTELSTAAPLFFICSAKLFQFYTNFQLSEEEQTHLTLLVVMYLVIKTRRGRPR